jgi:2-polyprenyl-3-methyl-5-hydroxy-6-metoxy-1,4-benzoquinol methylase
MMQVRSQSAEKYLHQIRDFFKGQSTDQAALWYFDIYFNEAQQALQLFKADLDALAPDASVLEVGAGTFLLSSALAASGLKTVALEPTGQGFGHFRKIQQFVRMWLTQGGHALEVIELKAEDLDCAQRFDYAFSINVMEHVDSCNTSIRRVLYALRPGGTFRFCCPNYWFPYEPHFGIFTLGSKKLTMMFRRSAIENGAMDDPIGTWNSLNWISVGAVRRSVAMAGGETILTFSDDYLKALLSRSVHDATFAARHRGVVGVIAKAAARLKDVVVAVVPTSLSPVIDARLKKSRAA